MTFRDIKKIEIQNLVLGNLLSQFKESKLSQTQINNNVLWNAEFAKVEDRLEKLKRPTKRNNLSNDDDNNNNNNGDDHNNGGNNNDDLNRRLNNLRYRPTNSSSSK